MYCTGHLLSSTLLATQGSSRLKVRFVPAASLLIASNAIDLDHAFTYRLDDGTANSLLLHGLHVYGGTLIFFILAGGLLLPRLLPYFFLIGTGIALHYAEDAFAYMIDYSIPPLMVIDFVLLSILLSIKNPLQGSYPLKGYRLFFVIASIVCTGTQAFIHFILMLRAPATPVPYIVDPILDTIVATAFFLMFNRQEVRTLATDKTLLQ